MKKQITWAKEELINKVVEQLKGCGRKREREMAYLDAGSEELRRVERFEVANRMGETIYHYYCEGGDYYFTLKGLIKDFYAYISGCDKPMDEDDEYATMSLNDYCYEFGVEEYKPL